MPELAPETNVLPVLMEFDFCTGPLSLLMMSVKNNTQVVINCQNNKKLCGRVRAFGIVIAIWFLRISKRYGRRNRRLVKGRIRPSL